MGRQGLHTPVTIQTQDGQTRATVVPSLGFTCIDFCTEIRNHKVTVLDCEPDFLQGTCRPGRSGIPILFPFPNRIRDSRFSYQGVTYQVPPPAWFPQTIHGFCVDRPWHVVSQSRDSVTAEFILSRDAPERRPQWPSDARLTVTYTARPQTLRADIVIENLGPDTLPWGFGTHPYFRLPLGVGGGPDQCLISASPPQQWTLENCFPTGEIVPVSPEKDLRFGWRYGTCHLDDVYTFPHGVGGTEEQIYDPVSGLKITQRHSADFRELVVFTPKDRPVICLEPYTCTTDAVNLEAAGIDAGLWELESGEKATLWFEIEVSSD